MYIGDLHIHSRYSRATSKDCTPEYLDLWAGRKGIHIVGTGDFTHPAWREELAEKLEPAEDGMYVLKEEYRIRDGAVPGEVIPRFVITGEISSIYKKDGKVRKVHSLVLLPGLEDAEKISAKLEQIGNIHSDGRPILGLDCHDLLEIVLELCPRAVYVPAHIWTPHFSLFGAFSGFDTVEECFGDLTPYIHAVETGLSSDPPMNWRVSALDRYQLISNSDAHSPAKLGREANLFDIPLSYGGLANAIQTGNGLGGTIEFFPEEGKYHMDGHRKCNLCLTPSDTLKYNGVCPVCGRKITIGVSHRVEELADREEGYVRQNAKPFESLVPLPEVIGASEGHSPASKKVQREYERMLSELGPEFRILRKIPLEEIRRVSGSRLAEGIARLRSGQVERIPGFDGEYGVIRLFSSEELKNTEGQMSFFDFIGIQPADTAQKKTVEAEGFSPDRAKQVQPEDGGIAEKTVQTVPQESGSPAGTGLNPEQEYAVRCASPHIAVKAGPGTGKTKTLISRLRYLMEYRRVSPSEITAVTFTNQAASEMRERIGKDMRKRQTERTLQIGTFHSICLDFLREQGEEFTLIGEAEQKRMAEQVLIQTGADLKPARFLEMVSAEKTGIHDPEEAEDPLWQEAFHLYEEKKRVQKLFDFDDLLLQAEERIRSGRVSDGWEKRFRYLLVDEFQDIDPVQMRLVKLWSHAGRELFVIGDPDQSIYGFRGADSRCFDSLKEMYDDLEVISLCENYRSSPQILSAAAAVIAQTEPGKEPDPLCANCPDNVPVRLAHAASPMAEAIFIAKEINRMTGGMGMLEAHKTSWEHPEKKIRSFDEIAVLCRTHHQAGIVEKCLRTEGIPYIVAGKEAWLGEEPVRNSICFFRLLESGEDHDIPAMEICAKYFWKLDWSPVAKEAVRNMADKFRPLYRKKSPQKFLEQWAEEVKLAEDPAMEQLMRASVFYRSMPEFLYALSLGVESDLKRCGDKNYTSDAVTILTLHGSKGLEFPVVFVYGVEEGSIPLESERYSTDKDEERRLLYVGMTRAKEELLLTSSGGASEFVDGLPDSLVAREEAGKKKKTEEWHQMSLFDI
ncbi:MAG TPA: UvrD-helicase domain-containing protein [Candidatus Mediterraneibacter colneyensis]|nr:UvrD-helicase domain-containing protein [Candidatus Mediterraneibacter colneyensis]